MAKKANRDAVHFILFSHKKLVNQELSLPASQKPPRRLPSQRLPRPRLNQLPMSQKLTPQLLPQPHLPRLLPQLKIKKLKLPRDHLERKLPQGQKPQENQPRKLLNQRLKSQRLLEERPSPLPRNDYTIRLLFTNFFFYNFFQLLARLLNFFSITNIWIISSTMMNQVEKLRLCQMLSCLNI